MFPLSMNLSIGGAGRAATGGASQREASHLLRELVHSPNARPKLEVEAFREPERRAGVSPAPVGEAAEPRLLRSRWRAR